MFKGCGTLILLKRPFLPDFPQLSSLRHGFIWMPRWLLNGGRYGQGSWMWRVCAAGTGQATFQKAFIEWCSSRVRHDANGSLMPAATMSLISVGWGKCAVAFFLGANALCHS